MNSTMEDCPSYWYPENSFIILGLIIPTIGIFGIFGNLFSAIRLNKRFFSSTAFTLYFQALCLSDLVVLFSSLILFTFPVLSFKFITDPTVLTVESRLIRLFLPIGQMAATISTYVTVTMTTVRFISVRYPFFIRKIGERRCAKWNICVVLAFSIVFTIIRFLEVENVECFDQHSNVTRYAVVTTELRRNKTYSLWYTCIAYTFVMFIVPFSILVVCNTGIIYQLLYARKQKTLRSTAGSRSNQKQTTDSSTFTTVLCLLIAAVFLICQSLPFATNIIEVKWVAENSRNHDETIMDIMAWCTDLGNLMVVVQASSNFLIYLLFSKKFRGSGLKFMASVRRMTMEKHDVPLMCRPHHVTGGTSGPYNVHHSGGSNVIIQNTAV